MWIILAFASAVFAALTTILAKYGIKKIDSTVATAVRTIVVLIFAWLMVFVVGSAGTITAISAKSWIFLILSGLATGFSWLCYFRALQLGDVNKVVPIDKTSTIMTLLLAFLILHEPIEPLKIVGMIGIAAGTWLMIEKKAGTHTEKENKAWILYAFGSAAFAALTSILAKIGIENVESNLGTAIRTAVVLVMAWVMVFVSGRQKELKNVRGKDAVFLVLSGIATGASWLCYFKALQDGLASVVVPIDKMSIVFTVILSFFLFKEKLSRKALGGLGLIVLGTFCMMWTQIFPG